MLQEGPKYLAGLIAILVIAGESSFASVEITRHLTVSDKHALEAQLTAARGVAAMESAQLAAARAQLTAARAQVTAARAQVTAARAQVEANAKAARARAAATSAQTVALRSHAPFAVAKDALARLAKMQRQVAQAANRPHAQRCLLHVLNHSMRQRRRPDALYRRHDYAAAASGYKAVTSRLALKAARCAPTPRR